ncbi:BTAD domain-containing putative transcriptional regulator [Frankia sp. QA3]|uniref:BTAD domain-containing putative transcriptional regulator n=1 Tax=Frankia sp. QA3 TaxID=710111 RepID=UPI00030AB701|nr:BTAD domain-containing putative transcriptional regulator [Frankia sp. QA3]
MQICVLGPLEVRTGSGVSAATVDVGGARLRTLLILLALDPGRTVTTQRLVSGLWADEPPAAAGNALQALVSRLRRTVPGLPVEFRATGYRLALPADAVDAVRFERLVADGRQTLRAGDAARAATLLRAALELWRGPPLADVADAPFARAAAARLDERRLAAIEGRVEADLRLGAGAELVPELAELVSAHPTRESLTAALMRALCAAGRPGAALDAYERLRARLADDVGADPSGELRDLHATVLRGSDPVGGAASSGMGTPPGGSRTNLRAALTSFVGRSHEADRVRELVRGARLVTLVGPGGAGKTRLAVETARLLLDGAGEPARFLPDGAWLVELAPVTAAADLLPAVFAALGLREQVVMNALRMRGMADSDPVQRLTAALAGRRLLLVLDNCEHLLDPAATLVEELLGACPQVRILATSREPLAITGETLWPVGPLALPPAELDPAADPAAIARYPAVRLFTDRAVSVRPGFRLGVSSADVSSVGVIPAGVIPADGASVGVDSGLGTASGLDGVSVDGQTAAVVRICRALDGMPLAIELAAARLRAMTPEQVAARLDDRFRLLTSGSRTALPRHRTLAAVVDWSWDLLDEPERVLWRRLAIFPGGVTPASARAVCADALAAAGVTAAGLLDPDDIPDLLTALVEKSLLVSDASDRGDGTTAPRYRQLETIREYGLQRLAAAGEREPLRAAHAAHFLHLAETAEPELRGLDQLRWLRRLTVEQDNLHAALRGAIAVGDAMTAVRMSSALGWYWWLRGHKLEGFQLAAAALDLPGESSPQARAMAGTLAALNAFDGFQDMDSALLLLRAAVRDGGDLVGDHPMLPLLKGFRLMLEGGLGEAPIDAFRECFDLPDTWARATARILFAYLTMNLGDHLDEADEGARAALADFEGLDERWGMAFANGALGELAGLRGEHAAAVAFFRRATRLTAELDSTEDVGQFQLNLVGAAVALGDIPQARAALAAARRSAQLVGTPELLAGVDLTEAELARLEGDLPRARELAISGAAGIWHRSVVPQFRSMAATSVAFIELAGGRLDVAREILAAALDEAVRSTDAPVTARVLIAVADLALHDDEPERAAELLGAATLISRSGDRDYIRVERAARAALGEAEFAVAAGRGRAVPLSASLDLARLPPVAWPPRLPELTETG